FERATSGTRPWPRELFGHKLFLAKQQPPKDLPLKDVAAVHGWRHTSTLLDDVATGSLCPTRSPLLHQRSAHHDRDVVLPTSVECVLHQVLAHLSGRRHRAQPLPDSLVGDVAAEPVAAQEHDGVPVEADTGDDRGGLAPADRARQGVREPAAGCVGPGEYAEIDQLLGHRLIAGDLGQLAAPKEIAPAVARLEQIGPRPRTEV